MASTGEYNVNDNIDVGNVNLTITVYVCIVRRTITFQNDVDHSIDISNIDFAITVHIARLVVRHQVLHNLPEIGIPSLIGLISGSSPLRHMKRAA